MEARAIARYIAISPFKTRPVVDLVRGRPVDEALAILRYTPKRASVILQKVIRSAMANADAKGAAVDELVVRTIYVDQGPIMKRWRPRAFGRANRMLKRTSHITVVVADSAGPESE
jgi:large subunit ribosomal protein L22